MKGSYRIARLVGIDVGVHWTFAFLALYVVVVSAQRGAGIPGTLVGTVFVLSLFVCVLLHEFGHALTARAFGVQTKHITLFPIGGVAALQRMPSAPHAELLIALAGPAVNVVIAGVLALVIFVVGDITTPVNPFTGGTRLLTSLVVVNLVLVAFNMLPAFPMDGGRVVRALLSIWLNRVRATRIAAGIGLAMAVVFVGVGLYLGDVMLLLIAGFVFFVGRAETKGAVRQAALEGTVVRDVMREEFAFLNPTDSLGDAAMIAAESGQHDFPVLDGTASYVGLVPREQLGAGIEGGSLATPVARAMRADVGLIDADLSLAEAVEIMQTTRTPALPVGRDTIIDGLLTFEQVHEVLARRKRG